MILLILGHILQYSRNTCKSKAVNEMKGYAMLSIGKTGWIEKDRPACGPDDAIIRPLAMSPCTSDVHTVWAGALGERGL